MPATVKFYLDSLNTTTSKEKKIDFLLKLASLTQNSKFIDSYKYATEAIKLANEVGSTKLLVKAYNSTDEALWFHADYGKEQDFYFKAYRINDAINDKSGSAQSLLNLGWIICIQQ